MSSIEKRASGASERSGQPDKVLTWHACCAMLPLVDRIAQDIVKQHERLSQLRSELTALEKNRRQLNWPQRSRRYQLDDDVVAAECDVKAVVGELEGLGVTLLDPACGLVGFPTLVNERKSFFSWQPGEMTIVCWNYAGDRVRRAVPE